MKLLLCFMLAQLAPQPGPRPTGIHRAASLGGWHRPVYGHWCSQPVNRLRWLNRLIQNAQSWPPYHDGWEVHQARYRKKEVFVLHLCRYCGQSRGFLLYNHYGELIEQGEGADSIRFAKLTNDRLLAASPGRFKMR